MPPRASTSRLSNENTPAVSRSPSVSARGKSGGGHAEAHDSSMLMLEDDDNEEHSSDEDELDEVHSRSRGNNGKNRKVTSRSSKQRSSTSAVSASGPAAKSPLEDLQLTLHDSGNNSNTGTPNSNITSGGIEEDGSGSLSKEEIALADRRRRNRETQRAIRKKKANRLQEAETKANLFETELESFKLKSRDLENELFVLKRELEDWRSGRIHANPTLLQTSNNNGSNTTTIAAGSTSTRGKIVNHAKEEDEPYRRSARPEDSTYSRAAHYQSYEASTEDRKVIGKRRQTFDITHQQPTSRHYMVASPLDASSNRLTSGGRGSPSPIHHDAGSGSVHRQSPSVLQPLPTVPNGRISPNMELAAAQRASASNAAQPSALDTNSNEEGSYGGSDPSPSSAGTVVPSYTSAFNPGPGEVLPMNASSTLINEAVQIVRAQDGTSTVITTVIPKDNVPRSHSILSTTTSISDSRPSSFDDYNDFWTSNSNSQSQSDSLTSMSSYKSSAITGHNSFSSFHLSGSAVGAIGYGGAVAHQGTGSHTAGIGADGMILSMSRSSLCASPLSIAEEKEENVYQSLNSMPVSLREEDMIDSKSGFYQTQQSIQQTQMKPSLPSLSSSLKGEHYSTKGFGRRSPDRTVSLPPPAPNMTTSPPQAPYLPSFRPAYPQPHSHHNHHHHYHARSLADHHQAHPTRTSPEGQYNTLPPIASGFQSRQATLLPPPSSYTPTDLFPPNKKHSLTTRNGRDKSTSFPILAAQDILNYPSESTETEQSKMKSSFNWPTASLNEKIARNSDGGSTFGGSPIMPLPRRASTRAPLSSTRDDDNSIRSSIEEEEIGQSQQREAIKLGHETVMSPSNYDDDDSTTVDDTERTGGSSNINSSTAGFRKPQRRKSTYEDFVELFGNQGTV